MTPEDIRLVRKALCNCRTLLEGARQKATSARQVIGAALENCHLSEEMGSLFSTLDIALDRWTKAEGVMTAYQRARDLFPPDDSDEDDSPTEK